MAQSPQLATVADTLTPARKKVLVVGATGFLGAKILHLKTFFHLYYNYTRVET